MQKYKILIVDDDPEIITNITDILSSINHYEFLAAFDGTSAIKIVFEEIPDIILLDWYLPGIDGIDVIKQIKTNNLTRGIPIIMITGIMMSVNDLNTALNAGATDFLRKPFEQVELLARVNSMLLLSKYYKDTIDLKNRELTAAALKLIKSNEFDTRLIGILTELKINFEKGQLINTSKIENIIHEINIKKKGNSWLQFEEYFKMVNPEFNEMLLKNHPNLTPSEIKLCTLLRLNISSKDIAAISLISHESVRISRTRLRKKLDLDSSENLIGYLLSI